MSKVSIIIPVYNAEKTLCRCLDSLVVQTYEDVEIILVNDGSVDSSRNICETYRDKYSQIILINQENAGPATARNVGISITHLTSGSRMEYGGQTIGCTGY